MKPLGGLVITCIWWAIIVELVVIKPSIITKETASLGHNTVSFNLEDATEQVYRSVIKSLRNELQTSTLVCKIPVTPQSLAVDKNQFVVVSLTWKSKEVQLGIDVTNAYVVGYQDKLKNQDYRAFLLKDAPPLAKDKLFPGVKSETLPFGGTYPNLVKAGNVDRREQFELGVEKLGHAIDSIFGKPKNDQNVARFFLNAIQIVSEAARFKYIENEVVRGGLNSGLSKPNGKMLNLENSWGHISDAIHNSNQKYKCETISPALELQNADYSKWVVNKVSEISPDLGILKYKSSKLTQSTTIMRSIVVEDSDELEKLETIIG
uniref:rRNA N-glycosylase n=2 Tax=Mesangiospermae TaxID=1437183 RepID=Q4U473_9CARY|nr:antiviral protein 1 [Bougainvillea buttiana]